MEPILSYVEQKCEFGGPDPGNPEPGIMQVFYENGIPLMVDFLCPCGCGHTCPTHLITEDRKKHNRLWEFSYGKTGGVNLEPSIRWTGGCYAHFNITDGKTHIHGDSGVKPDAN